MKQIMKQKNRILATLLCLCMVVTLLPTVAFAAEQPQMSHVFETTQSSSGTSTLSGYDELKSAFKEQIVPQAVNAVLKAYPKSFGYLKDSAIGVGLNLSTSSSDAQLISSRYNPSGSYVEGRLVYTSAYGITANVSYMNFSAQGTLTDESRCEVEAALISEIHNMFMMEATTCGLFGANSAGATAATELFPNWFIEGMGGTVSGAFCNFNDWVNVLGITGSTPTSAIAAILDNTNNKLTAGTTSSIFGTGYLACMYLGYLASGETEITPANIAKGLDLLLSLVVQGKSLNQSIKECTTDAYTSVSDFETKFGDTASVAFVAALASATGEGNGSIVTENFSDTALLPDEAFSTRLFQLNIENTFVQNTYPDYVHFFSGGGKASGGMPPISATVSPATAVFNKTGDTDKSFTLIPDSYNTLSAITIDSDTLTVNTDYTVSGNVYTIKKEKLAALTTGSHTVTFDMGGGTDPAVTLTVTDNTSAV